MPSSFTCATLQMPFMYLFDCFTIAYMKTIHYSWKFIQNYDNKEWKINHEYLLFEEYFYAFF